MPSFEFSFIRISCVNSHNGHCCCIYSCTGSYRNKMGRKFFVGGNWKMNGTKAEIDAICSWLTAGPLDPNCEVIQYFFSTFISHSVLGVKMDHQASCLNPLLQWFPSRWWLACLVAICSTWWTKCQTTSGSRLRTATRPPREPSLEN